MTNNNYFPGLDVIILIEEFTKAYSGEVKLRRLWQLLPRRIKYSAFVNIMNYLQKSGKVSLDERGYVHWTKEHNLNPYASEYA